MISPPFLLTFLIITSTKHFIFTFNSTHVSKLLFPLYSEVLLMYSMTLSSSKYFTESPRLMKRRASVDETSLATQFVTMWIFRRYLLRRSESKMNCSGLLPLRVMTTSPCWPRIDSSWWENLRFIFGKLNKFIKNFHLFDQISSKFSLIWSNFIESAGNSKNVSKIAKIPRFNSHHHCPKGPASQKTPTNPLRTAA